MTLAETARALTLCDSRTRDRALFGSWVTTHYPMLLLGFAAAFRPFRPRGARRVGANFRALT
jgi:hypothetical protein